MAKTSRVSFRFSETSVQRLRALAERENRSMASMVEILIEREFIRRQVMDDYLHGELPGQTGIGEERHE